MALPETLVRQRSAVVYLKEESTAGTSAGTPVAGDAFALTTVPVIAQAGNYSDTSEIGSELITTKKVLNYMDYSTFDLEFYAKPNGTAGNAPVEDNLLDWFFGAGAASSNPTAYTYSLANKMQTFSIWSRQFTDQSIQLFHGTGCAPTSWGLSLAKDGPVTYSMGIQAAKVQYGGTAQISGYQADTGSSPASDTYTIDAPVRSYGGTPDVLDIAFAGMPINVLDSSANYAEMYSTSPTVPSTVASGATLAGIIQANLAGTPAAGDLIVPDLPAPACATNATIDQQNVAVYLHDKGTGNALNSGQATYIFNDNYKLNVTAISIDIDRSLTTPGLTEMTGSAFPPATYVINEPTITGSMTVLLRPKDFQLMNSLRESPIRSLGCQIGTTAGSIIQFASPAVHMEVPTPGEADGATQLDISFTVVKDADCDDADKFVLRYA